MKRIMIIATLLLLLGACTAFGQRDSIGASLIDDTWLNSGNAQRNYGITTFRFFGDTLRGNPYLMEIDVSGISGPVEIASCSVCVRVSGAGTGFIRRVLTPWTEGIKDNARPGSEGGATFNRAKGGSFPVEHLANSTSFNTGDYVGSAADSITIVSPGYICFTSPQIVDDVEKFINGDYSLSSWVIHSTNATGIIHSTETTTGSPNYKPYVIINQAAAEEGPTGRRRKELLRNHRMSR